MSDTQNTATEQTAQEAPLMSDRRDSDPDNVFKRSVFNIPLNVQICIGSATPTVSELLQMKRDSLLKLGSKIDDPVELRIGTQLIARGELTEIDDDPDRLGVRLTEVIDINEEMLA